MKSPYKINLILLIIFLLSFALVLTLGTNRAVFININSFAARINPFILSNDENTGCENVWFSF